MYNKMAKKELKEMIKYFAALAASHKAAGRIDEAFEYGAKRANCERELLSR